MKKDRAKCQRNLAHVVAGYASPASFYHLNTLGSKKSIFGSLHNFPRQSFQFPLKIHFFGLGWGTPPFRAPALCAKPIAPWPEAYYPCLQPYYPSAASILPVGPPAFSPLPPRILPLSAEPITPQLLLLLPLILPLLFRLFV